MICIGIDVGRYSVKVATLEGNERSFRIQRLDEYPLSQDPNRDQTIELLEIFRDIKSRSPEGSIITAVPQDRVSMRRKTFPFKERHKIFKSLPFELEEDIPFIAENAVIDFKLTHYRGSSSHVLACACPKDYLKNYLRQYEDSQMSPNLVSVEGLALANIYEDWRLGPLEIPENAEISNSADLVFHIGHLSTLVLVIQNGYLLDAHQLDWGGKDLADIITQKYSLRPQEALKELKKKAFILISHDGATRDQMALSDALKTGVDQLAHSLQLILLEIKNNYNLSFRQATLSGGVSLMRNLGAYLTQKLEIPVNRLTTLPFAPDIDFSKSPNNEIAHVNAIGLALEGFKRPKNPAINLLKAEFARQSQALQIVWDRWKTATYALVAVFLILTVWGYLRYDFASQMALQADFNLRDLARKILNERRVNDSMIRGYIRDQNQKAKMKEVFEDLEQLNTPLDVLKKITQVSPPRSEGPLIIHQVHLENEVLRIVGETNKTEILNRLQNSLKNIASDKNIETLQAPQSQKAGFRGFHYSIKVARKSGG